MKKYKLFFISIICIVLLLTGCQKNIPGLRSNESSEPMGGTVEERTNETIWDRRPMVKIKGELYFDTGHESDINGRCGVMDGEISSSVDGSEIPVKDNQSNFGKGYGYQRVDENNIDLYMDDKWIRFEREMVDAWGIHLSTREITPTGLILECNQSGGEARGELQTGSPYWVEAKVDNQWVPIEMLPSQYERGWTDEAWIIHMNGQITWEIDWVWLYGELSSGDYRIGKEIMNFRGSGDYDMKTYYANFCVPSTP